METYRILIVDDAFFIRNLIKRVVANNPSSNYSLEILGEASNYEEALSICKNSKPDIITIDSNMPPGPDGVSLIKEIKSLYPDISMVMISEDFSFESKVRALGCSFILKPFQEYLFYSTMDDLIERHKIKLEKLKEKNKTEKPTDNLIKEDAAIEDVSHETPKKKKRKKNKNKKNNINDEILFDIVGDIETAASEPEPNFNVVNEKISDVTDEKTPEEVDWLQEDVSLETEPSTDIENVESQDLASSNEINISELEAEIDSDLEHDIDDLTDQLLADEFDDSTIVEDSEKELISTDDELVIETELDDDHETDVPEATMPEEILAETGNQEQQEFYFIIEDDSEFKDVDLETEDLSIDVEEDEPLDNNSTDGEDELSDLLKNATFDYNQNIEKAQNAELDKEENNTNNEIENAEEENSVEENIFSELSEEENFDALVESFNTDNNLYVENYVTSTNEELPENIVENPEEDSVDDLEKNEANSEEAINNPEIYEELDALNTSFKLEDNINSVTTEEIENVQDEMVDEPIVNDELTLLEDVNIDLNDEEIPQSIEDSTSMSLEENLIDTNINIDLSQQDEGAKDYSDIPKFNIPLENDIKNTDVISGSLNFGADLASTDTSISDSDILPLQKKSNKESNIEVDDSARRPDGTNVTQKKSFFGGLFKK